MNSPYTTGRRLKVGSYRFNKLEGRFEFFGKYFICPSCQQEYQIFFNRGEMSTLLKELDHHYGHTGITMRIMNKVLPEKIKRQLAGDFE